MMSERVRAFIAVAVPAARELQPVLDALGGLGRAVRPVAAHQLHVTLKFLGDVEEGRVAAVIEAVAAAAAAEPPLRFRVVGLGAFPHAGRPSVVWVGVEPAEALSRLAADLERRLATLGFAPENRPFTPHLTLARVKARPPAELASLLRREATTPFHEVNVEAIELFRSDTGRDGPVYTPLFRAALCAMD